MVVKPIQVTFKQKEKEIHDFLRTKSSPASYIKDLIKCDMQGKSNTNCNTNTIAIIKNEEEDIIQNGVYIPKKNPSASEMQFDFGY